MLSQSRLILTGTIITMMISFCQGIDILGYNMNSVQDPNRNGGKKMSITQGSNGYDTKSCIHIPDSLGPVTAIDRLDFCLQMYTTNDCDGKVSYYLLTSSQSKDNLPALNKNPPKSFKSCQINNEEAEAVGTCNKAGCKRGLFPGTPEYNFWVALFHALGRQDWLQEFQRRAAQQPFIQWDFLYDSSSRTILGIHLAFQYFFPSRMADQYQHILHFTLTLAQQGYIPYATLQNLEQLAVAVFNNRNNQNARHPYNPNNRSSVVHVFIAQNWGSIAYAIAAARGGNG